MATTTAKKTAGTSLPGHEPAVISDVQRFLIHIQQNAMIYVVIILVAALALVLGAAYNASTAAAERQVMTAYAEAMQEEDAAQRAAALEPLAQGDGRWGLEAAYMLGETAIELGDYKKAQAAFTRIIDEAIDSDYAPGARQGLAFCAEATGDLQSALDGYEEVARRWPDSFIGHIQALNIGRVKETMGDFTGAKAAYERQVAEFADSKAAARAQAALDKLKDDHPDLFPAVEAVEAPAADAAAPEAAAVDAAPAAPAAEVTPAPEAAAPVPAETPAPATVDGAAMPAESSAPEAAPAAEATPGADSAAPAPAGDDFENLPAPGQITNKPVI